MTEIKLQTQLKDDQQLVQLDLLFEIYKKRKMKEELQLPDSSMNAKNILYLSLDCL